jgi:3-hydroxybutyryl-CoA dehydratase
MTSGSSQLYFEDFKPGAVYAGQSRALAGLTGDAHPIHYDRAYAMKTRFGERVAHGLLLMSMTALGATPLSARVEESMIAFVEQDAKFLKAVLIGETVRTEFEVESVRPTRAPAQGIVRFAVRVLNAGGEVVLAGHHTYLLKRRQA